MLQTFCPLCCCALQAACIPFPQAKKHGQSPDRLHNSPEKQKNAPKLNGFRGIFYMFIYISAYLRLCKNSRPAALNGNAL